MVSLLKETHTRFIANHKVVWETPEPEDKTTEDLINENPFSQKMTKNEDESRRFLSLSRLITSSMNSLLKCLIQFSVPNGYECFTDLSLHAASLMQKKLRMFYFSFLRLNFTG